MITPHNPFYFSFFIPRLLYYIFNMLETDSRLTIKKFIKKINFRKEITRKLLNKN